MENGNSCVLLVEMQNGIDSVENSLVLPQSEKYRITIRSSKFTPRYAFSELKAGTEQIDACTPMFIAALFTTTKR